MSTYNHVLAQFGLRHVNGTVTDISIRYSSDMMLHTVEWVAAMDLPWMTEHAWSVTYDFGGTVTQIGFYYDEELHRSMAVPASRAWFLVKP